MTIKCHEFFGCRKRQCKMFLENEERNCWDVPGTFCMVVDDGENLDMAGDEKFFCKNCLYYEHVNGKKDETKLFDR